MLFTKCQIIRLLWFWWVRSQIVLSMFNFPMKKLATCHCPFSGITHVQRHYIVLYVQCLLKMYMWLIYDRHNTWSYCIVVFETTYQKDFKCPVASASEQKRWELVACSIKTTETTDKILTKKQWLNASYIKLVLLLSPEMLGMQSDVTATGQET